MPEYVKYRNAWGYFSTIQNGLVHEMWREILPTKKRVVFTDMVVVIHTKQRWRRARVQCTDSQNIEVHPCLLQEPNKYACSQDKPQLTLWRCPEQAPSRVLCGIGAG